MSTTTWFRSLALFIIVTASGCAAGKTDGDDDLGPVKGVGGALSLPGGGGKSGGTGGMRVVGFGGAIGAGGANAGFGGMSPGGSDGGSVLRGTDGGTVVGRVDAAVAAVSADAARGTDVVGVPRAIGSPGGVPAQAAAFDDTKIHTFDLKADPADLAKLPMWAKDPKTESMMIPATLVVDGVDVGKIGIRYKGSFGTLLSCIDGGFKVICPKMSYKVKFDEFDTNLRWHALKKINLHSMVADPTKMHEHLGYKMFNDMGLVAPRAAHATVTINGQIKGVYALTEAVDGRFTADRFAPTGDGNLYKEAWPNNTDPKSYAARLETNEDKMPTNMEFANFASDLAMASTQGNAALAAVVDRWANMDYMLRYTAVDRIISNWDGFTTFYCGSGTPGSGCGNHNLYWYLDQTGKRFWLVIWDLDNTWQLITDHEILMPIWTMTPADCKARTKIWGAWEMPASCDPVFRGMQGAGAAAYQKALKELLDKHFDVAKLHADIDRRASLMAPVVMTDPTLSFVGWMGQVAKLKNDVVLMREKLQTMSTGGVVTPFGLQVDGINDFEGATKVPFGLGTSVDPNPASSVDRRLNTNAPLGGATDARVDFTYRTDGKTMWTWMNWKVAMAKGPADMTNIKRLRLRLKTDVARTVRIDFDSANYKMATGGRFGWNGVPVTAAGVQVVLDLDKTTMPDWAPNKATEVLAEVRKAITAVYFTVDAKGIDGATGFFPDGKSDTGFLQIDDIEFLP